MGYNTQLQSRFAHTKGEFVPAYTSEFPAHPAIVHFPIAFNSLAWCLDILYALSTTDFRPRSCVPRYVEPASLLDLCRMSYFLLRIGLITTVPAIISGNIQLLAVVRKNGGIWEKDTDGVSKQNVIPRIKAAIAHAMMNNLIFVLNLCNWYLRRSSSQSSTIENAPSRMSVLISLVLLPSLITASKLGGTLVFNHGIGLNIGRKQVNVDLKDI